uniref:Uncharacterized protein n=1 Tax=Globodera rostochiensis TaxID=31243 RepID=A0A914HEB8_GLORO
MNLDSYDSMHQPAPAISVVVMLALVVLVSARSTTTTSFGPNLRLLVVDASVLLTCLSTHCQRVAHPSNNFLCDACFEAQKLLLISALKRLINMPSTDDIPADQNHPASSSSAAACLPAPVGAAEHVSAPIASSALHSLLSPWAIGVVVLLALVVLVSAWSTTTTTSFGPNRRLLVVEPHSPTAGSQYGPASAAPPPQSPAASGRFSNGRQNQPQQQINALRAKMDQLQYELGQLQQYAPAGADWMEPVWPFSNIDYHPKSMLVRRHMAWQPMRRGIENDERSMTQRHIAWQPMKRQQQPEHGMGEQYDGEGPDVAAATEVYAAGDRQKQQVMRTVEQELIEVLRAGERLGVSADEILAYLRAHNNNNAGGGLGRRRR